MEDFEAAIALVNSHKEETEVKASRWAALEERISGFLLLGGAMYYLVLWLLHELGY